MSRHKERNWGEATAALQSYVKLRPADSSARFELAHTYLARAQDMVAREVLDSVFDEQTRSLFQDCYDRLERRSEGVYLYGSCLAQIARGQLRAGDELTAQVTLRQALAAIERHFDADAEGEDWTADLLRLQAECQFLLGQELLALASLRESFAAGNRSAAKDGWAVLHRLLLAELETWGLQSENSSRVEVLAETLTASAELVRVAFGARHRAMLVREFAVALGIGDRVREQLDLSFGPRLEAKHPDGATWLAYERWSARSFAQAWQHDVRGGADGGCPRAVPAAAGGDRSEDVLAPGRARRADRKVDALSHGGLSVEGSFRLGLRFSDRA